MRHRLPLMRRYVEGRSHQRIPDRWRLYRVVS